jgi:hypothetical protein
VRLAILCAVVLLLPASAQAIPIADPCQMICSWEEVIPPPNMDPDPPQSAEEYMADLLHEPEPILQLVCILPPKPETPVQTPEPAVGLLLVLGMVGCAARRGVGKASS